MNKIESVKSVEVDPGIHLHAHVVIEARHSKDGVLVVEQVVLGVEGVEGVVLAHVEWVIAVRGDGVGQHLVVPQGIVPDETVPV